MSKCLKKNIALVLFTLTCLYSFESCRSVLKKNEGEEKNVMERKRYLKERQKNGSAHRTGEKRRKQTKKKRYLKGNAETPGRPFVSHVFKKREIERITVCLRIA